MHLADGSLLSYMTDDDRDYLFAQGVRRTFAVNDVLLREGDPSDFLHVVLTGWVRVSTTLRDGHEVIYALRGPGDILGELAALHGWARTASVRGIEAVTVVQLSRAQFLNALRTRPDIGIALVKTTSVRLREAEAARVGSAALDISKRIAIYLVKLVAERGRPSSGETVIDTPLSQEDIARQLGASRRTVARALGVLRERGVVSTGRKRIVVHRLDVLRSIAKL